MTDGPVPERSSPLPTQTKLAVILHADIVGSTALVQKDEHLSHERMQAAFRRLSAVIAAGGGTTHEIRGDALVAEFDRASDAAVAALDFQAANQIHNASLEGEIRPAIRIGIAIGEVIVADNTVTGAGVVLAQRLEQLADVDGICISAAVREAVPGRLSLRIEDLGQQPLKGITLPQHAYRLKRAGADEEAEGLMVVDAATPIDAPKRPERASIAVLPFDNMSGDSEQEYFSDGISEDIITALSRIRQFFVIARNTTFTYKGSAVDVQAVARDLNVRYVLEGSVRKSGSRVRITAQLIDGATGNHLWGEKFDRVLEDIFDLQDEITQTVVSAIEPELTRAEWGRAKTKQPESLDAWDLVVQAIALVSEFSNEGSSKALELLEQAIATEPTYARAHAHFAWTTIWRAFQGWDDMGGALETASASASRAIQLDANEPWAYLAVQFVAIAKGEKEQMVAAARKAIELSPSFAYAHSLLGAGLALVGQGTEALHAVAVAMRLSPRDIWREEFDLHAAFARFQVGDYAEAVKLGRQASAPRPEHLTPRALTAASLFLLGEPAQAAEQARQLLKVVPGYSLRAARQIRYFLPDDDHSRLLEGLRGAGIPE